MINPKILEIANQLQDVVQEQVGEANKALANMPDGKTKDKLKGLLKSAQSGNLKPEDAQREITKILSNAG